MKALDTSSPVRLVLLTLCLIALTFFERPIPLSPDESVLYSRVRAAQDHLWTEMEKRGHADPENDIDMTGFIGLEWSESTTSLGSLESKRSACDPLWAAQCLRWFNQLGLKAGDRIVILSSASFPGMLYSVLAAGEFYGLKVDFTVSLGSSTWGANRPDAPWPVMEGILRQGGFLSGRPAFYTMGGGGENGGEMTEEAIEALISAAEDSGVELFRSTSLWSILERKTAFVAGYEADLEPKLVVNVGGALSNMGRDQAVIILRNGLLFEKDAPVAGDGMIAISLKRGIPVLHLLNLSSLAERSGIDFDSRRPYFKERSIAVPLLGIALFILVLYTHRRWTWE
jgi:poly-gamma-glutamate system protein